MRAAVSALVASVALSAGLARAQERPDEDAMFGGEATETGSETATATTTATTTTTTTTTATATATTTATTQDSRDDLNLSDPRAATRFSVEVAPEDPLKIGGQLYWRAMSTGQQGQYPQNWSLRTPALLDVYMDARPNERVRAFGLARTSYDPTQSPSGTTATGSVSGGAAPTSDSVSLLAGQGTRGPTVALDQLWLRFDILRRVFVTAGKQHVRWGTARFWAPTDYMHQQARNPLLPFDARTGTTMLKLHVPWEARGWNFYVYALPEAPTATARTGDVAGAARVEIVLGTLEAGAGVFGRRNSKAKLAGDVSFGVWDLDFYGEAALRNAGDVDFVHYQAEQPPVDCLAGVPTTSQLTSSYYPAARGSGWRPQVTGGVSYTRKYADKDTFTIGAEYFYNGLGYTDPRDYLGLLPSFPREQPLANPASFFYLGRHYAGIFALVPAPYSWDTTTFTLSTLANLSDLSGLVRLDYALTVLTHVRFEAYGAVRYGQRNGEFRMAVDLDLALPCTNGETLSIHYPPALFDIGVGLRVAL